MRISFPNNYINSRSYPVYNNNYQDKINTKTTSSFSINNNLFKHLSVIGNYNISFVGKTSAVPVYAIDRDMNCKKFASGNKAAQELGVPYPSVSKCLSGKGKYAGDYCFTRACDIEILQDDGTYKIDMDKVKQIYETAQIARTEGANVRKQALYAIDKEEKLQGFESVAEAAKALNVNHSNISSCLSGTKGCNSAGGYVFFKAETLEMKDEDGNMVLDEEKFKKAVERVREVFSSPYAAEKLPVYAIYKDGSYKKYDAVTRAVKELKVDYKTIITCLSRKDKFIGDYTFILASAVETVKKDGSIKVNEEKIKEKASRVQIARENDTSIRGKAVYAINLSDNSIRRFGRSNHAAKELGIPLANVSSCLSGKYKTVGGYVFIPAYKIEIEEGGVKRISEEKLMAALKEIADSYITHAGRKKSDTKGRPANYNKLLHMTFSREVFARPTAQTGEATESIKKSLRFSRLTDIGMKEKKKYIKLGQIYAVKPNGDYLEFENYRLACEFLDIDAEELYKLLKGSTNKYNGLLFSCDGDG